MDRTTYSVIALLSGILCAKSAPAPVGYDLSRPCGTPNPSLPVTYPFFMEPVEVGTTEMLTDLIINMREGIHNIDKLMKNYREEAESTRFAETLISRHARRFSADNDTSSSLLRAFPENLQLDFNETSKALLYLNSFRSSESQRGIMERLKLKTLHILCRLQELIQKEGEELSPPVQIPQFYNNLSDEFVMRKNEYDLLQEMKDYLTEKACLYGHYKRYLEKRI